MSPLRSLSNPPCSSPGHPRTRPALLLLLSISIGFGGCVGRRQPDLSDPAHFRLAIRDLLRKDRPTPEYYEMWSRLQDMGPEVDAVLLALARDRAVNTVVRSNALILLAERRAPGALDALERALTGDSHPRLRAAAVLGLQRLAPVAPEAMRLIREAVYDPVRAVRLNALQALDVGDVVTVRAVLEKERDNEVRQVAMQLISIAEARGAPLAMDRRGALRSTGAGLDPQIVFRPTRVDPATGLAIGDLRLELPGTTDIPLSSAVEVSHHVVPAFFSPDRARVVFESEGQIRIADIPSRSSRSIGAGTAPRVVPFSNHFVFLREESRVAGRENRGAELVYAVYDADFGGGEAERIGELHASTRPEQGLDHSPVRTMLVAETPEGFVLRGDGLRTFLLPARVWGPQQVGADIRAGSLPGVAVRP